MDVRVGLWRRLSAEELICGVKLWCWKRLLSPLDCTNLSILKEISPGISLKGMMLKLKLQYFGHLMRRVGSLEKTLMLGVVGAGGEGDNRGWDGWMASVTQWTWVWVNSGSWCWTGRPGVLQYMGSQRVGQDWATEQHFPTSGFQVSLWLSKASQLFISTSVSPTRLQMLWGERAVFFFSFSIFLCPYCLVYGP